MTFKNIYLCEIILSGRFFKPISDHVTFLFNKLRLGFTAWSTGFQVSVCIKITWRACFITDGWLASTVIVSDTVSLPQGWLIYISTCSQEMLMLLLWGPHFEKCRFVKLI